MPDIWMCFLSTGTVICKIKLLFEGINICVLPIVIEIIKVNAKKKLYLTFFNFTPQLD